MRSNQVSTNHLDELGVFALMAQALAYPVPGSAAVGSLRTGANGDPVVGSAQPHHLLARVARWLRDGGPEDADAVASPATEAPAVTTQRRVTERGIPHPYY
jgi:hypothetical protein